MYFQYIDLYISQNLLKTRAQKYMFCHVLHILQRLFLPEKVNRKTFFLDQFPIVHSRNINNHFFLKLVTMRNMYRDFLNVGFAQKENI